MPGRKARKNAQPSPPRAPAGRDQMGSAGILARAGAGRGPGRAGAGAGAVVDVSVGTGSVCLLGDSGSGHVCAHSRVSGRAAWKFFKAFTMETAREGAGLGTAMQLHFSGCPKPPLTTLAFHAHLPCPGAVGREKKRKFGRQPRGRKSSPRHVGTREARRRAGLAALPKPGLFSGLDLRGPCPGRYHSPPRLEQKQC